MGILVRRIRTDKESPNPIRALVCKEKTLLVGAPFLSSPDALCGRDPDCNVGTQSIMLASLKPFAS